MFPLLLIVFLPIMQDSYDTGRWVIVNITSLFLLLYFVITIIRTKKISFVKTPLAFGFGAITITTLISLFFASTNKIESIVHPLGLVTYLCLFLTAFLLPQLLSKDQKRHMLWALLSVIGLLGLIVIYQQFQIASIMFPQVSYLKSTLWNPTGTPISAALLFLVSIPLAIYLMRDGFIHHKERNAAFALVAAVLMTIGLGITLWRFLPLINTVIMPIPIGWTVLLESFKNIKTAFFGIGAENFLPAYALGRPISMNLTPLWNTGFSTSATFALHITTTLGLLGLVAFIITLALWFRSMPKQWEMRALWIIAAIALLILPPSIPFLLCIVLVSSAMQQEKVHTYAPSSLTIVGMTIATLLFTIVSIYGLYRFTNGEYMYAKARASIETENNLTMSYNYHILAIKQNQYITRYHLSLSQLALVMGGSILGNAPKNDETGLVTLLDDDKTLVTSLFGLAVSEAKLATSLAPNNYVVWTNLATVYQSLIGVASDAQTWTIAAYQKAVTLNPISPTLRVDFGGMYMNAKDYDGAITQFFTAVTLKQNYANGYYNLANAYRLKGDNARAIDALKQTRDLLPKDGTDYAKVLEEIQALQNQLPLQPEKTASASGMLTKPVPTRVPLIAP
ncbi:MAG: tetratricopeptide repeat protein [Candidatus Gottesmanbacteria bacterium]